MKPNMIKLGTLALGITLVFTACKKVNYPNPTLGVGQCEYAERGYFEEINATKEMNRIKQIFQTSTIGHSVIQIIKSTVFKSSERISPKGNSSLEKYGFQIVFSCNQAEIKHLTLRGFLNRVYAENAYLAWLSSTPNAKIIDVEYQPLSRDCHYDMNNNQLCVDSNFSVMITYAVANPSNPVQAEILQASDLLNRVGLSPSKSLKAAEDYFPLDNASKQELRDWSQILKRIRAGQVVTETLTE